MHLIKKKKTRLFCLYAPLQWPILPQHRPHLAANNIQSVEGNFWLQRLVRDCCLALFALQEARSTPCSPLHCIVFFSLHQRQHRKEPLRSHPSRTILLKLFSPDLRHPVTHPLPHTLRDRPGSVLQADSRRREPAQVSQTSPHPLQVFPCSPRIPDQDVCLCKRQQHLHD